MFELGRIAPPALCAAVDGRYATVLAPSIARAAASPTAWTAAGVDGRCA